MTEPMIKTHNSLGRVIDITRDTYVRRWTRHADELMFIGIDVRADAATKAGEEFDRVYANNIKNGV